MARRTTDTTTRQLAFTIEGMVTDASPVEDVFALWVHRVAECNQATAQLTLEG